MKRITLISLMVVVLACLALPATALADVADPVGTSTSLFNINTVEGGEYVNTLSITNKLDRAVTMQVSAWHDYTGMGEGETEMPTGWIISLSPAEQLVPAKGAMLTNIVVDIPEGAEELRYKTWIKVKVLDYPQIGGYWEKPITIVVRKGQAATSVEFSVYPAYYRMLVDRYNAHLSVNTGGQNEYTTYTTIRATNKCGVDIGVFALAEDRGSELVIKDNSSIQHTAGEVGMVYENVSTEEAREWFSTPYTVESPLIVKANGKGNLTWSIDVPDDLDDGHYVFGVRVGSTDNGGNNVNVNYMVWMLMDVARGGVSKGGATNWQPVVLMALVAGLVAVIVVPPVYRRMKASGSGSGSENSGER